MALVVEGVLLARRDVIGGPIFSSPGLRRSAPSTISSREYPIHPDGLR